MKRIAALVIAGWPILAGAHPCPYDWNIEFSQDTKIEGKNLADFAKNFNDAVRKETNGKIDKAIIYQEKPDVFTKVPENSPYSEQMNALIRRYAEVTAPLISKGVTEYGGTPWDVDFEAHFPVACILSVPRGDGIDHNETKEGLIFTIGRKLECRAYKLSDKFLRLVDEVERDGKGYKPVPYTFAKCGEMTWELFFSEAQQDEHKVSILDGVTLYLPDQKVILALDTKNHHEEIAKSMKVRGYIEKMSPEDYQENPKSDLHPDPAKPESKPIDNIQDGCEDSVIGVAEVVPTMDCSLFKTAKTSYQSEIFEHEDGHLENTFTGQITAKDLLRVEHTADCTSSHQGKHLMEFCDAVATKDGVEMTISGGMPAYASNLTITINNKLEFNCFFSAVYPDPTDSVHWKVTKKALKLKTTDFNGGKRLRGWISVEFDEIDKITKETHAYKIEGFFKPVIQTPQKEEPSKEGKQADPTQPESKPIDKAPAKDQPTPATK